MNDDAQQPDAAPRPLQGRLCFGALVGILMGSANGWAYWWIVESLDFVGLAIAIGAILGLFGGLGIAYLQAWRFPESINPDIATFIGIAYALLPAISTLMAMLGVVHGKISGYLAGGMAFAFPASGALVGALLDRIAEAVFRRAGCQSSE